MTTLAQIESMRCPGYVSPTSGETYGAGKTHRLTTRNGVRCATCGVDEPTLRTLAERPVIVATFYWNTEADGTPVDDQLALDDPAYPRCHFGPFATEAEAAEWMQDAFADDTDVAEAVVETVRATYVNPADEAVRA